MNTSNRHFEEDDHPEIDIDAKARSQNMGILDYELGSQYDQGKAPYPDYYLKGWNIAKNC